MTVNHPLTLTPPRTERRRPWRRGLPVRILTAAAVGAWGVIGVLTSDPPAPHAPGPDPVRLVPVPGGVAAVSQHHGPHLTAGGLAAGFSHDELGAAVAATNLAPRVSAAADHTVYEATINHQGWGDPAGTLARLGSELPAPDDTDTTSLTPTALFYRILAGDPNGDHVVVSLLADTGQARSLGGWSRVDLTLRWLDGDWRLRLPTPRPSQHPDTAGYTPLGTSS